MSDIPVIPEDTSQRTVQAVFDKAIWLLDEQNEANGSTITVDTKSYANRTPGILNTLLDECYPASDTYPTEMSAKRPICKKIAKMEDVIDLDEVLTTGVLPYGLAGHLILNEGNDAIANYLLETYREKLGMAFRNLPAVEGDIVNLYGGIEKGEFADW